MSTHLYGLQVRAGDIIDLTQYVAAQLHNMFPDGGLKQDVELLVDSVPQALGRMRPILRTVHAFETDKFDHFNSLQYATFLYLVANECWRMGLSNPIKERLFSLNKALNSIDLFYSVEMPEVFFVSHGVGSVLGNAEYGNQLVFFQNVTVGRVGNDRPKIGENVVLYPGAIVTGCSEVGNNCVVSAGTVIHGACVPDNVVVGQKQGGGLEFKSLKRDYLALYLNYKVLNKQA